MSAQMKNDILHEEDIKLMVDAFYNKVLKDELLAPVFTDFAKVDWKHHLPVMYKFWNHLILGLPGYSGRPFPPHTVLPIVKEHFERWLYLFKLNVDENFSGANADLAKDRAENIAAVFQYRLGLAE